MEAWKHKLLEIWKLSSPHKLQKNLICGNGDITWMCINVRVRSVDMCAGA